MADPALMPGTIPYANLGHRPAMNRHAGLLLAGIGSLVLGTVASCVVCALAFDQTGQIDRRGRWQGTFEDIFHIIFFAIGAVLLIWIGIDSLRHRRWVRPVVLAIGWPALVLGALTFIGRLVSPEDTWLPRQAPETVVLEEVAFFLGGVAVPLLAVWFYSRISVRHSLEAFDTYESWTEGCPLSVFILCSLLQVEGLISLAAMVGMKAPFFGRYLEGWPAGGVMSTAGIALLVASYLCFCGSSWGWLLAAAILWLGLVTTSTTLLRTDIHKFDDFLRFLPHPRLNSDDSARLRTVIVLNSIIVFGSQLLLVARTRRHARVAP